GGGSCRGSRAPRRPPPRPRGPVPPLSAVVRHAERAAVPPIDLIARSAVAFKRCLYYRYDLRDGRVPYLYFRGAHDPAPPALAGPRIALADESELDGPLECRYAN